jgi:FlaA1/EpsC-like NDP-sugar epimerase
MTTLIPEQRRPSSTADDGLPGATTKSAQGLRTLVVGAGTAGVALVGDLRRVVSFGLNPVGYLDDDPLKQGRRFRSVRVLGTTDDLERVLKRTRAEVVVIAIPSMNRARVQLLGRRAAVAGARVQHLPPFLAALQRDIAGTDMRALHIGSLIGRHERRVVRPDAASFITGKRVLVTGAGGSIGSELCRQVNEFHPSELVMLDHDESNLHRMQLDLAGEADLDSDNVEVADIRDAERIHQIFRDRRPQIVFHAAALKHLPVLERHPCEGVKSNVRGTENLVEAAVIHEAERFVLVSTDKAANPTSVLGATKRLAELLLMHYQRSDTALASVRFGNVLGSRGSLLQVVREQLALGTPVTVTHPDMTRFFMTIEEAVGLVLESARMAQATATYVLDMGESVRIVDLIRNFATQLNVDDVEIRYTGLRPGEKLDEELFGDGELCRPTDHPRISKAMPPEPVPGFRGELQQLYAAANHNRPDEVVEHLRRLVPEYRPTARLRPVAASLAPYPDDY